MGAWDFHSLLALLIVYDSRFFMVPGLGEHILGAYRLTRPDIVCLISIFVCRPSQTKSAMSLIWVVSVPCRGHRTVALGLGYSLGILIHRHNGFIGDLGNMGLRNVLSDLTWIASSSRVTVQFLPNGVRMCDVGISVGP